MASATASKSKPTVRTVPPAVKEAEEIFQLKISIKRLHHNVWRRVLVRKDTTLAQLHSIIQDCFQWHGSHLHSFRKGKRELGRKKQGLASIFDFGDSSDEDDEAGEEMEISKVLSGPKDRIDYTYDFGDDWEHSIVLEKVVPHVEGRAYPVCTAGRFRGPPEDCGSSPGYKDICDILAKPKAKRTKEDKERIAWLHESYPDYNDPADFSPAQVIFHGAH